MADHKPLKNKDGEASQYATGDTVGVAHGGTGATDAAGARTNLDAQQQHALLDELAALTLTKGDVLVHDGTNLNKLDVGSNGQVLAANSAQAAGVEWVDTASTPESTCVADNGNAGTITKAQPVYMKANGDVDLASANSASTCFVLGFVQDASVVTGAPATIQLDGEIELGSTGAWDALTGGSGGLTPGAVYAVSTATAGSLVLASTVSGAGNVVCPCLLGISATKAKILDRPRVHLT